MNPAAASAPSDESSALAGIREALASGRLDQATERCEIWLGENPTSADALSLMGEIRYRRGDAGAASPWLEKALARDRRHARSLWLLGNIHHDQGQLDRAIASYRRALRAAPQFAEAHNDLGAAYHAKSWYVEAAQCYRRALELDPDNVAAVENLATTLRALGRFREARDLFARTLKLRVIGGVRKLLGRPRAAGPGARSAPAGEPDRIVQARQLLAAARYEEAEPHLRAQLENEPDDANAYKLLAVTLLMRGQRIAAIAQLERAVALRPATPELHVALGNALAGERRYMEALRAFQVALALDPGHAPATVNIARVLHELGHFREAEEAHRLSLEQDPDLAVSHGNLAATLLSLGKFTEAEASARKSIELKPQAPYGYTALASALMEEGRLEEALSSIEKARSIEPRNPVVLRWLGRYAMTIDGDFERAESYLEEAKSIAPEDPDIRVTLARALLSRERFAEGWEEYEWRKRQPGRALVYTKFTYPEWNGEPLEGKAVVLNNEQGLGDEIMFASCLPDLAGRAGRCVLYCERRLEALFRRSFPYAEVYGGSHVTTLNDPFPIVDGIDYQVAAASLPRVFRRSAADFPQHEGYLKADPEKISRWRDRVAALGPGLKVGLSWKGGTPLSDQTRRTLTLERLDPILTLPGVNWISLQYGDCHAELNAYVQRSGIPMHHWQVAVDDLDETVALMCALDLRISVCNTQVHLSGGLGREVWVLAPLTPDWRYGHRGERMLWYPAARMFRQPKAGDWDVPIDALRQSLIARLWRTQ